MSRPIRSALTLAHSASASAGPSSIRPSLQPQVCSVPSNIIHSRSAWSFGGFDRYLPSFGRPSKSKAKDTNALASTETDSAEAVVTPVAATPLEPTGSLFDEIVQEAQIRERKRKSHEHQYKTAQHKISPRKLNMISRQIAGLPVDEAILQMQFSEKRASSWIKSTLALARDHAMDKGISRSKMIVAQTWVSNGPKLKRIDIKGRGRGGIKYHPTARLHVLLKEGKTKNELEERKFAKELGEVRSAGIVREDGVIRRKVISGWTW